jgi:ketosteroid isomerase-like protein
MAETLSAVLTVEQIKGEVQRFWNAFMNKDTSQLAEFYAHDSTVFSSLSSRPEPGRLAAARRQREYFNPKCTVRASVGIVDVVLLDDAAVATYNFQFHATKIVLGKPAEEENITNGRATHVFAFDPDHKLRIVHEHLSEVVSSH